MRLAQDNGIPSMMVATGRLLLASVIITPLVLRRYRDQLAQLTRLDMVLVIGAGFWVAVHFVLLAYALENATVLVVSVIINTSPLWVALLEKTFLKANIPRVVFVGLVLALMGSAIISIGSGGTPGDAPGNPTLGAILTLLAAAAGAVYIIIGRKERAKISILPYVWMVFGIGGLFGCVGMLLTQTSLTGHSTNGYFWLLALAVGPQLVGHSGFNYALGYISATLVSLSTQAIVITSTIVAFFVFHEVPGHFDIIGSVIIVFGVSVAILGQRKKRTPIISE